jgi:cytochrome c nitrite reductase small subunit
MSRSLPLWTLGALSLLVGVALGLGFYTFGYAEGYSYMLDDPSACANCHVMNDHYAAWLQGPHRAVASCNDCHTPPGLIAKYATKASNGFWHSFAFTTGHFHEPIRIKPHNRRVSEQACRKCHTAITTMIDPVPGHRPEDRLSCIRCHSETGHIE